MTNLLFSVLAAASLTATAAGATSETRSAQSLPVDQLAVAPAHGVTGNHQVSRLADAAQDSDSLSVDDRKARCDRDHGHWNVEKLKCRHGINPAVFVIGAAATGGFIYAMTSRHDSSTSQSSVSH